MLNIIKSKLKNTNIYNKKSLNNSYVVVNKKDFVPAVRD
jgi:hypothetical protein